MPALNIEFTEEEMEQIRQAAAAEQTSVKKLARTSVLASVHRRHVMEVAARVARVSSGLNRRLAQ
ncbi:hypothetical protein HDA32_004487 [Spinactinospora alkalitolerans]|uniref:CopG family transcriptional regulator n=1 Tax=Spinactinospora alkalitolerans TaxID=687207 RepID=A0A852U1B5_9ACTN|nr:hypothetical protein [Spinactinospora alkalitolerans]NYE49367.1 hypothetical protein [Spinactinospora alkalitolerans]